MGLRARGLQPTDTRADRTGRNAPLRYVSLVRADELDYELPEELIAQEAPEQRDGAKLLMLSGTGEPPTHHRITELPGLVPPALWIFNDTKVIPARLFGRKASGGKVELLLIERESDAGCEELWLAMGRASKSLKAGTAIHLEDERLAVEILDRLPDGSLRLRLCGREPIASLLREIGHMPLPPYIRREDRREDHERYQTLFAQREGAIAAPTAGLHFSEPLLDALRARGHRFQTLTLHVGPGTFQPLRSEVLSDHPMHQEHFELSTETVQAIASARAEGRPVIAVGTTVVRSLESCLNSEGTLQAQRGSTRLFIYPPYQAKAFDFLLTNFHLPRSTLLALVMAVGGQAAIHQAYDEAIQQRYRFFSYGDAMLIPNRHAPWHKEERSHERPPVS